MRVSYSAFYFHKAQGAKRRNPTRATRNTVKMKMGIAK